MVRRMTGVAAAALVWAVPAAAADNFWSGAASAAKDISASVAQVPSLADIEALETGIAKAWERTPLTQRHVVFVNKKPELYGSYEPRPTNTFKPGQALVTYLEPVGYTWVPSPDGMFRFGFTLDFKLKTPDGKILGGQDGFQSFDFSSRYQNREVFMNLTLTLSGIEPGSYVLAYTLHDRGSSKVSTFEQPFAIQD